MRQPSPSGTVFLPVPDPAPARPAARGKRARGPRVAGVAALIVILVAAASVAVALSARAGGARGPGAHEHAGGKQGQPQAPSLANVLASQAAAWVDQQVSHSATVACDKAMCSALAARGFPGRHLRLITPGRPVRAQIMVDTPAVRDQLGSSAVRTAPAVLTSIGTGSATISIRIVAPEGAAAYQAELKASLRASRSNSSGLLTSSLVTTSATARKQLLSGRVDARLVVILTAMASAHPIRILGFGTAFPGASPGIPLRTAFLAQNDPAAGLTPPDYLRFLLTTLDAQQGMYRPQTARVAPHGGGNKIFEIGFPAPSPLKLLGG